MNKINYISVFFLVSLQVNAYEQPTHIKLSYSALNISNVVIDTSLLSNLGLKGYQSAETFQNPDKPSDSKAKLSILDLIGQGANFEDKFPRSLNHFYDPVNNRPLTVGGFAVGRMSPDWALEDNGDVTTVTLGGSQDYSYQEAMHYFYEALTLHTEEVRNASWGKTFQTLGQVIHHVQDMSQPEHVRNDQHLTGLDSSLYEKYTDDRKNEVHISGLMSGNNYPIPSFVTAREFWTTPDDKGVADFTNMNFVSKDTNFIIDTNNQIATTEYNLPVSRESTLGDISTISISDPTVMGTSGQTLCTQLKQNPDVIYPPGDCVIEFASSTVTDSYHPASSGVNERASSFSVFNQYLQDYNLTANVNWNDEFDPAYQVHGIFTLNRFNFDAAHNFLIPRAVAYSAGLINHFFRGRLQISLPDAGVYGFMDHSTVPTLDVENGFEGFDTIKLKVTNVTPALPGQSTPETMNDGAMVAVIKFHRNTCWQDDLSGNAPHVTIAPDPNGNSCRSPVEEIVVADEPQAISTANALTANAQEFTFRFTTNQLPLNAIDVYLQVVYRGQLGNEADVVVAGTKDISEPSFLTILNSTDYLATVRNPQNYNAYVVSQLNHAQLTEILADLSLASGDDRNDYCIAGPENDLYWNGGLYYLDGITCIPAAEPELRIYDKYTINQNSPAPIKITMDGLPQQQHATLVFLADKDSVVTLDNTGMTPLESPRTPYQDVYKPHVYCGYEYPSTCQLMVNQTQFGPDDVMPPTPFGRARNVYGTGPVLNVYYTDFIGALFGVPPTLYALYLPVEPAAVLSGVYQDIDSLMNPVTASGTFTVTIEDW